jgi:hypothetical protein
MAFWPFLAELNWLLVDHEAGFEGNRDALLFVFGVVENVVDVRHY